MAILRREVKFVGLREKIEVELADNGFVEIKIGTDTYIKMPYQKLRELKKKINEIMV